MSKRYSSSNPENSMAMNFACPTANRPVGKGGEEFYVSYFTSFLFGKLVDPRLVPASCEETFRNSRRDYSNH